VTAPIRADSQRAKSEARRKDSNTGLKESMEKILS